MQVRSLLNPRIRKYISKRLLWLAIDVVADEWTTFHIAAWTYFDLLVCKKTWRHDIYLYMCVCIIQIDCFTMHGPRGSSEHTTHLQRFI
jgi:hypothetical protein